MEKIYYNEKEYNVTDRICNLISTYKDSNEYMDYTTAILDSKNYQEGIISEQILLAALTDRSCSTLVDKWLDLLTSEIFATGLISYEIASKLVEMELNTSWSTIDHKYQEGIIGDEYIHYILHQISLDDEYCTQCTKTINILITMLTSDSYQNKQLTDDTINNFLDIPEEERSNKIEILEKIFFKDRISTEFINDENLKSILETKTPLIDKIIYYTLISRTINSEIKAQYILSILNIENQEGLTNVYTSYMEKQKVDSIDTFAKNFVSYTLPLLYEYNLQVSYTKKREKNN